MWWERQYTIVIMCNFFVHKIVLLLLQSFTGVTASIKQILHSSKSGIRIHDMWNRSPRWFQPIYTAEKGQIKVNNDLNVDGWI